jgi:predicted PurR-regulated permease PerM
VGDRIGLHPVAVIFAIMAGGQLFGFTGILLALPVAAVAMVLLRYVHEHYTASQLYGAHDADPEAPASRIIVLDNDTSPPDAPNPGT